MLDGKHAEEFRVVRPEFNAILRLIRTFKAVNEDWPHVPSARPLSPHRACSLLCSPSSCCAHLCMGIRTCVHVRMYVRNLENVLVRDIHAAGALMVQHAKRILYSITISSGL